MDDVINSFENVAVDDSASDSGYNYYEDLYKFKARFGNQEERRKEILDVQKRNRNQKVDKLRGIVDIIEEQSELLQKQQYRPTEFVPGFMFTKITYSNILMLSEWLVEKPEDFHENWYVVPCPKGIRMVVVASKGQTKCFLKFGQFKFMQHTALPGGNPYEYMKKNRGCLLDCFYDEITNTMYVLDILAWNNLYMSDGETEFRDYWLKEHISRIPEVETVNKKNGIIFKLLPKISCARESFNEFMMKHPHFEGNHPALEGLLFYHKKVTYTSGQTPLVGWLYPFMVQEVLGMDITVNSAYNASKPADYVNQAVYISIFEAKKAEKEKKKKKKYLKTSEMETEEQLPAILDETLAMDQLNIEERNITEQNVEEQNVEEQNVEEQNIEEQTIEEQHVEPQRIITKGNAEKNTEEQKTSEEMEVTEESTSSSTPTKEK